MHSFLFVPEIQLIHVSHCTALEPRQILSLQPSRAEMLRSLSRRSICSGLISTILSKMERKGAQARRYVLKNGCAMILILQIVSTSSYPAATQLVDSSYGHSFSRY